MNAYVSVSRCSQRTTWLTHTWFCPFPHTAERKKCPEGKCKFGTSLYGTFPCCVCTAGLSGEHCETATESTSDTNGKLSVPNKMFILTKFMQTV